MSKEKHSQIAQRAREIWQREGCPEGRADAHWKQAEEELRREAEQTGSSKQSAPYAAAEPMIEPAADSPVVAGVSAPSEPPITAAEAEQRKSAPASTSEEKAAPYVPSDEPMIEPEADSPVIAGAVPSKPPIPAAEAEERKRAAAGHRKSTASAAPKTHEAEKAGSKSSPSKSDDKKPDAKKKKKG